uniref:Uncharacterized protein n=1 Tax=Candidatus Kentrum sp. FW TaxID=2126338 RepID=A0A450TL28_9GAMM|nr:MAG: hypothetical protein BECKFW1821B_GA0114236_11434 [Candidatus Kentron sp. FW]
MILAHDTVWNFALVAGGVQAQRNNITRQHRRLRPPPVGQTRLAGLASNGRVGIRVVAGSRIEVAAVGRRYRLPL